MGNTEFKKKPPLFGKKEKFHPIFFLIIILLSNFACTKAIDKKEQFSPSALEHYALGIYYQESKEDSLAVEQFKLALIEEPKNIELLSEIAFSLSMIGNYEEAEVYAEMAIKQGATDDNLYIILGNSEKKKGEIKKAVSYYKKALSDTSNYYLVNNLAQLMRDLNMIDEAILLLKALMKRYPFDLRIYTRLGDLYGKEGEFDLAIHEFRKAMVVDSLYYPALLGLGIIYEVVGEMDSSLLYYKKASNIEPENVHLLRRIIEFQVIRGEWVKVRDCALKALSISPTDSNVRKQLAYAYYKLKENEMALEQYLLLSGFLPKDAGVHHFLGRLYYEKGNFERAEQEFSKSLAFNPDFTSSLEFLLIISIKDENEEKAMYFFSEMKKRGLKSEEVFFFIGTVFYREKDYQKAKIHFLKSIAENPEFAGSWYNLGFVYEKSGNLDSAEYSFRKVIEIDTVNANSFNALGYLYVENNMKLEEAEKLIRKALEIDSLNGYFIDSLGWLYYKLKEYEKAEELFIKAKELAEDPVIYEHLGDVYEKLGELEKAKEEWKRALELDPENEAVKKKLE